MTKHTLFLDPIYFAKLGHRMIPLQIWDTLRDLRKKKRYLLIKNRLTVRTCFKMRQLIYILLRVAVISFHTPLLIRMKWPTPPSFSWHSPIPADLPCFPVHIREIVRGRVTVEFHFYSCLTAPGVIRDGENTWWPSGFWTSDRLCEA